MLSDRDPLPPVLFPGKDASARKWLAALKRAGRIRSAGPRLYVSVPARDAARVVRAAWIAVVRELFPDALLSHRSALELKPTQEGALYLTSTTNRRVEYDGLTLVFGRGHAPRDDDPRFAGVPMSSRARAFLENLSTPRGSSRDRMLPRVEVENRLEEILRVEGEAALLALRDHARTIARAFEWRTEMERLDGIIGTLLGTRRETLTSDRARARALGQPYDAGCMHRLSLLAAELHARPLERREEPSDAVDHIRNKAFFDAYLSNYIEGTTFEIEEAEAIVFDGQVPETRPIDAHDILGTFALVSDPNEMRRTPRTADELLEILAQRHATLMERRPEASPGRFKEIANRAGETRFVAPELVEGTLREGFRLYESLEPGMPRAAFMMFLVSDVHPFVDGNGRIARVMMNAELTAAGEATVIIPTVFRDDYVNALRALTRRDRPDPMIRALLRAQHASTLDFAGYPRALSELRRRNWFAEPDEAKLIV